MFTLQSRNISRLSRITDAVALSAVRLGGTFAGGSSGRIYASGDRLSPPAIFHELRPLTLTHIEGARPLHPAFYMDPEYLRAERQNLFGSNWFAAAHAAELAKPGDVKLIEVNDASIILTRDAQGTIHAFYNVCRHRGARVCAQDATNCKQLVCPYHWWAYRLDGSLKSAPLGSMSVEQKADLGLKKVPGMEMFGGIIFLNQSANPLPLADTLGDLPEKLRRYDLAGMTLAGNKEYSIKADWKIIAENFVDFYHINAVHPALSKYSRVDDHEAYQGSGNYAGFVTSPLTDCGGPGDMENFNCFSGLKETEVKSALFFQVFPNLSLTIYPHSVYTLIAFPGSKPGTTREKLSLLMAPGAQLEGETEEVYTSKCKQLLEFVCNINDEDVEAMENLHKGLADACSKGIQGQYVPKYDWPLHRFHNWVLRKVAGEQLEEGYMPVHERNFGSKLQ